MEERPSRFRAIPRHLWRISSHSSHQTRTQHATTANPQKVHRLDHVQNDRLKTILTFDDFQSEPFEVKGGIDQGDPLLSASYNFYSTDLVEPSNDPDELKSAL